MKKFLVALLLTANSALAANISLNEKNTVVFRDNVNAKSVTEAQIALQNLVKLRGSKDYIIYLVLDCPGGSIVAGDAFVQYAKMIPNLETVTIFAASMCSAIAQQLPGKRHITENGISMFHRAHAQIEGYLNEGELEEALRFTKKMVFEGLESKNAKRMQMTDEAYKARVATEWWMYGSEAVEFKAADVVSDVSCSQTLTEQEQKVLLITMFGDFELIYSGCPLFRAPIGVGETE